MYAYLDIYSLLLCLGICALTYESFLVRPQPDYEGNKLQQTNSEFIHYTPLKKLNILLNSLLDIFQSTQNISDYYTSNQFSAAAITLASDEK